MSGEKRPVAGWLLPVVIVAAACGLAMGGQSVALSPASLKPVNWVGIGLMAAGAAGAVLIRRQPLWRLAGVAVCGIGAILVICL